MPQQFVVPQFIDVEDKIFGPISVRQFVVILGGGFIVVIEYFIFPFIAFLVIALITFAIIALFAFYRINGQNFHIFLLNLATTMRNPKLKLWGKRLEYEELVEAKKKEKDGPSAPTSPKATPSRSRLQELSLIVDTGGAYGEESWELQKEDKDII